MPQTCDACGRAEHTDAPLAHLEEIQFRGAESHGGLDLCLGCLAHRAPISWRQHGAEGSRLLEALTAGKGPHALSKEAGEHEGRYTYMAEGDERIHLLQLRPEWVHDRAQRDAEEVSFSRQD